MRETILSATVLLCAVFLIRGVLKGRFPAGARYALWALVALRLLVPVNVGTSAVSVANWRVAAAGASAGLGMEGESSPLPALGATAGEAAEGGGKAPWGVPQGEGLEPAEKDGFLEPADQLAPVGEKAEAGGTQAIVGVPSQSGEAGQLPPEGGALGSAGEAGGRTGSAPTWNLQEIVKGVWLAGGLGMALWFALSNLRLWGRLRRSRRPFDAEGCPLPVYRADFLPSPCLAGVVRPAIYLNREAAEHPQRLKYILAHELSHKRHGDNWWALVRAACLCLWWFHPLVWIAAVCSRRDCELSCDAAAVRTLGEEERVHYGRTLVEMVAAGRPRPGELMSVSTAMTEGPKQIKERVIQVSAYRKIRKTAVAAAVCLAMLAGLCTFTGAVEQSQPTQAPLRVEREPGLTAESLEVTDEVSIPDFNWTGTEASYSREVAMRFMAEYGKRLYGLPNGAPWKAVDVAVLGTDYEWTGLTREPGDWGREAHQNGKTHEVWETVALAVRPERGLDAVRGLYGGGLPRGTGLFADYALMEYICSLTLENGRWYAHGNGAYSLALRMSTTPPGEDREWTDEEIQRWTLDYKMPAAVTGDDRHAWEEVGGLWAADYIRQHLTAQSNGSPAKADDARLTSMELQGWSPSENPEALYFHLEYTFRPVWGERAGALFISQMDDNHVGAYWTQDSDYVTVTAAVTLRRAGTENGAVLWSGAAYEGQYAQNYANGMDLSFPIDLFEAAGEPVAEIDPVGVSVTFPAGTDETKQRYAVFGLWAAEFGQQFYRLPEDHPLYCDGVEVNYPAHFTPTQLTSSGVTRVNMGATDQVSMMLRPVNGQQGAAKALGSDRTYVFSPGTNGRDQYDGKIDTYWQITLARSYNADASVTWTCTQGRPAQDSDRNQPETTQALSLPYHVEPKAGLSLSTLDSDLICVPNDGKGDLDARWAVQFGQQFYALPDGAAWKASDVMVYDAGGAIGLAIQPVGGLEALAGQYQSGYPCVEGKGELAGHALLQYNPSFRLETIDLFGTEPVWVKDGGGINWIPGVPEVGSEDWQENMEHGWKQFMDGNYSYLSVYGNEPGDPEEAGRAWAENFMDGLLGARMWDSRSGSPLQADSAKIVELTQTASGEVEGEQSVTFNFRYAFRPVWGMEIAKACAPDLTEGTGDLAGYAVRSASLELRFRPGKANEEDGYGYQRAPEGRWYCAGMTYRSHPMG